MTPSLKDPTVLEQYQDDCTGENFVRNRAVSQIDRKQWGTKRDLPHFYVNMVLQNHTSLDTDYLFIMKTVAYDIQDSVTVNTMKQSVSGRKKNPVLLKEEEENVAEETYDDADVNTEANEINDKKKDMTVTMK